MNQRCEDRPLFILPHSRRLQVIVYSNPKTCPLPPSILVKLRCQGVWELVGCQLEFFCSSCLKYRQVLRQCSNLDQSLFCTSTSYRPTRSDKPRRSKARRMSTTQNPQMERKSFNAPSGEYSEDINHTATHATYYQDSAATISEEHRQYLLERHGTIDLDPLPSNSPADPYNWADRKVTSSKQLLSIPRSLLTPGCRKSLILFLSQFTLACQRSRPQQSSQLTKISLWILMSLFNALRILPHFRSLSLEALP